MKQIKLILIVVFFDCCLVSAQSLSSKEIAAYTKRVDSLRTHHALRVVKYRNMCACAGALTGYYDNGTLVYIKGVYGAELGYTEQRLYLKDTILYKAYYRQYFAEWDKYFEKYPDREAELDEKKMTYSDTLYRITFTKFVNVAKTSKGRFISHYINPDLLKRIRTCVKTMYVELEEEKKLINN